MIEIKTVGDVIEKLPSVDRKEVNPKVLEELFKLLTPTSNATVLNFQNSWEGGASHYDSFVIAPDKVILECLDVELSPFGTAVRKAQGLEALTLETVMLP